MNSVGMTLFDAIQSGQKYFRRKDWCQWIYINPNTKDFFWKHSPRSQSMCVSIYGRDVLATDWEVWSGVVEKEPGLRPAL